MSKFTVLFYMFILTCFPIGVSYGDIISESIEVFENAPKQAIHDSIEKHIAESPKFQKGIEHGANAAEMTLQDLKDIFTWIKNTYDHWLWANDDSEPVNWSEGEEGYDINLDGNVTPARPYQTSPDLEEWEDTLDSAHDALDEYRETTDRIEMEKALEKFDNIMERIQEIKLEFELKTGEYMDTELPDDWEEKVDEFMREFEETEMMQITGDPLIFSMNGEACTERREMGSHDNSYWRFNLFNTEPEIKLNMDRDLCPGTMMMGIDLDLDGSIDNGHEILYVTEGSVYHEMERLNNK